jgi:hypothetical protein
MKMEKIDINVFLNEFETMLYIPIHLFLHHDGQKQENQVLNLVHNVWFDQYLVELKIELFK